jgi:lipopolysaccharide transport system ATP-binding protein
MKRSEVGRQVHQVLEFAGPRVRQFIDAPVKHYSSGMKVRLGFAVSAHIRNEILVIDEVLSVGDAEFRERSLEKMREIARSGRTILFVSHSMPQVRDLCARTLLLEDGRLVVGGETSDVIREYLKPAAPPPLTAHFEPTRDPALPLQFVELELVDAAGRRCVEFDLADPIRVDFRIKVDRPTKGAALTIQILQGKQILAMSFDTDFARAAGNESIAGERGGSIQIPPMLLKPGEYDLTFHTGVPGVELFQKLQSALRFRVTARSIDAEGKAYAAKRPGGFILKAKWSVNAPIEG